MSEPRTKIRARVQVLVEIDVSDVWGGDCPTDQIYRQAKESAIGNLRQGLAIDGLVQQSYGHHRSGTVIGEPKVVMVIVEEQR